MIFLQGVNDISCCDVMQWLSFSYVDIALKKTTCSVDAFFRGPRQKVIAFSFYGDPKSDKSKARGKK